MSTFILLQTVSKPWGRRKRLRTANRVGYLMILPALLVVFGLLLYPLLYSLLISFYDLHVRAPWKGWEFIGFGNYFDVLTDREVHHSLGRTLFLAGVGIGLGLPLSLAFAMILNQPFPLRGLVRGLLIIPWIIPGSVQGLLWSRILEPYGYGALNGLLIQFGWIEKPIPWLLEPMRALFLVAIANLWSTVPMMTLLYLAGLQGIPQELYEAAKVDGAGRWARFQFITLPFLAPVTLINLILKTIDAFALFDLVFVLTGGGPARATEVIGYHLYTRAFTRLEYGYASALAWVIAVMTTLLALFYNRLTRPERLNQ
ncbi:carbohydrate ABC transporter permease [Caldilinea sp.]|uniref:carbohydrate ABC transporter permease n=1 Tax=Caldilinea sp. TaxID=2293560 RepID=UPI0021DEDBEC|nr:sugar ABC transporter permease [Caldilinea sp.]GIV69868.1 MAG: sugar ABC transporter permease [Caldilinea sp.]